ncbi:hypothetical protein HGM15179_020862 [Zosterops borbonicus]|uniref:Uncharacterized protein n=1 Tax=Zosterops borbonicus TaxID=364589 RepID=A0A8K1FYA0_9PASS|nr:hypothetical protein HGM15179_020862 [Zosterops borbonicus]
MLIHTLQPEVDPSKIGYPISKNADVCPVAPGNHHPVFGSMDRPSTPKEHASDPGQYIEADHVCMSMAAVDNPLSTTLVTLTRFGARIYRDPCLNAFCVDTTFEKGKRLDVFIEMPKLQEQQTPSISSPVSSPEVSSVPGASTSACKKYPIVEREDWDAADPVVIENNAAKWKSFNWKVLRKAKETVKTYGLRSEAAQNIIHHIYTVNLLCPADCTSIASLLLTPLQLLIFERQWQHLAAKEASRHRQNLWKIESNATETVIEWVFLPVQPKSHLMRRTDAFAALIRKGRDRIVEIDRKEPADISIPARDEDRIKAIMSSV